MSLTADQITKLNNMCPAAAECGLGTELDAAATLVGGLGDDTIIKGKITLNGVNPTPVVFQDDTAAVLTSTNTATFNLTGVGDGGTIIAATDGESAETATVNFAAATSVSGASPSTDISGETDTKFNISVDGDAAEEVTLDVSSKNSGALIAAEMQTKIQALGGNKASVTVAYTTVYTITSPTYGTDSSVVITPASSGSITEELKIGEADGGTETAGTGDVADASAATAQEIVDVINGDMSNLTASVVGGAIVLTSDTAGKDSSIVMGDSGLKTVLGLAQAAAAYGAQGLGFDFDMSDTDYAVVASITGTVQASLASKNLSTTSLATDGFDVECETAAATDDVFLMIIGTRAS